MQRTLFNTPLLKPLLRAASIAFLRVAGWKTEGRLPAEARKSVFIAVPHTSNWDLPYTLMAGFAFDLNLVWMGKESLFRAPFGPLMRWLGGLPVARSRSTNAVASAAQALREATGPLQLVLAPEATRGQTRQWRTGFYYIALEAQVPIVMAWLDYRGKRVGLGPAFTPTGDLDRDLAEIRRFYANVMGPDAGPCDAESPL